MRILLIGLIAATTLLSATRPATAGETLAKVKADGVLSCGTHGYHYGFATRDDDGKWHGFDADYCRAVAAAVLGDPDRVDMLPLTGVNRLPALQDGDIDLLALTVTWTLTRDTQLPLDFAGVNFYDGQGFLAHRRHGWTSIHDVSSATVCVEQGTTTIANMADFAAANGIELKPLSFATHEEATHSFFTGGCDLFTGDISALASIRAFIAADPASLVVLNDRISKEPLSLVVREDDREWFDIVKWVMNAMVQAEEWGITSANAEMMRATAKDAAVRRFLGAEPGIGAPLGLDDEWAYRVVSMVGNYGEVFERNIGQASALKLERGLNALWTDGGLMYAKPMR